MIRPRFHRPCLLACACVLILGCGFLSPTPVNAQGVFLRGDCNQDAQTDLSDAIFTLNFLFIGGESPICLTACDINDDTLADLTDAILTLEFLFLGTFFPAQPFPDEGVNTNPDGLDCANGNLPLIDIRVVPGVLNFHHIGDTRVLNVIGTDSNGEIQQITRAPPTRYESQSEAIATVTEDGAVTAVAIGETLLVVGHRGLSVDVPIVVLAGADGSPSIHLISPASGSILFSEEVIVVARTSDPLSVVGIAGLPANGPDAQGFFSSSVALTEGANTIELAAVNPSGTGTASLQITRAVLGQGDVLGPDGMPLPVLPEVFTTESDTTAPTVTITSPSGGAFLASVFVDVEGTVDDTNAAVLVNNARALVEGGTFIARGAGLDLGANTIVVSATDRSGNQSSASTTVTVLGGNVQIELTSPATDLVFDGLFPGSVAVVGSSPVLVAGRVEEEGFSQLLVNGVQPQNFQRDFSLDVVLRPGLQRVAATVEYPSPGSGIPVRAVASHRIFLDTTSPSLDIIAPAGTTFTTASSSVVIAGRVHDDSIPFLQPSTLTVDIGAAAIAHVEGRFAHRVDLDVGANSITVRATDGFGRQTEETVAVTRILATGMAMSLTSTDAVALSPGGTVNPVTEVLIEDVLGAPREGVPVVFDIALGDGLVDDQRRVTVLTDANGHASTPFSVGEEAGPHILRASSPAVLGSPAHRIATVDPDVSDIRLVASGPRWIVGGTEQAGSRALSVRALDPHGNALDGVAVTFDAGEEIVFDGATTTIVSTAENGRAAVEFTLPEDEGLRTITASTDNGSRVVFTLDVRPPGTAEDTRIGGLIVDAAGQPLQGVLINFADFGGILTQSDADGGFNFAVPPLGAIALDFRADGFFTTRREVSVFQGTRNVLPDPVVLVEDSSETSDRAQRIFVSETASGKVAIPALLGWSLEISPNSVVFADGSRSGWVQVRNVPLESLPAAVPDSAGIEAPCWILPADLTFDPPARVESPTRALRGGRQATLYGYDGDAGTFVESGQALVDDAGLRVTTLPGGDVRRGGLYFFSRPGAESGTAAAIEGSAPGSGGGGGVSISHVPQHDNSMRIGIDVFAHNGEFVLESTDLHIPGRGFDFNVRRRYESRHDFQGALGWGWENEYADRRILATDGSNPGIANAESDILRANGLGRFDRYLYHINTGAYVSPIGVFSRLYRDGANFIERQPDGTRFFYHPLDGNVNAGRLFRIADRNDNEINFDHVDGHLAEARDTLDRQITYVYNEFDRIESITDFMGRTVIYSYDETGDLVSVTSPAVVNTPHENNFSDGKTTRYVYDSGTPDSRLAHNIVSIFSPSQSGDGGEPYLTNVYQTDQEARDFDRVLRQDWGDSETGGAFIFSYDIYQTPSRILQGAEFTAFLSQEGGRSTVVDPCDIERQVTWSQLGLPLSDRVVTRDDLGPRDVTRLLPEPGTDPPFIETQFSYTGEGLLIEKILPRGNRVVFEYDNDAILRYGRGTPVKETHFPAPGDSSGPIALERIHDPLFGRLVRYAAPYFDGVEAPVWTVHVLDFQEGLDLLSLSSHVGASQIDVSNALDLAGIPLGRGDLNEDGEINGVAANTVQVVHPTTTLPDDSEQVSTEMRRSNHFGQPTALVDPQGRTTTWSYYPETDPYGDGNTRTEEGLDATTGGFTREKIVDALEPNDGSEPSAALRTTRFLYGAPGFPLTTDDGLGNQTLTLYNALGQLVEARGPVPLNYRRRYFFDADDRIERFERTNAKSSSGFPLPVSENLWITQRFERDILGQVTVAAAEISGGEVGPEAEAVTQYSYDPCGRLNRVTHPNGVMEEYVRDERGLVYFHRVHPKDGVEPPLEASYLRDVNGNVVRWTSAADVNGDGNREARTSQYDGFDRPLVETDEVGGQRVFEYDARGNIVMQTTLGSSGGETPLDRDGTKNVLLSRDVFEYDERGRRIRHVRKRFGPGLPAQTLGREDVFFHDGSGRVIRHVADLGTHSFEYDGAGQLRRRVFPNGDEETLNYDAAGRKVRQTIITRPLAAPITGDGFGADIVDSRSTVFHHDVLGRPTISVGPDGSVRHQEYDSRNNITETTDQVALVVPADVLTDIEDILPLLNETQLESLNRDGNRVIYEYDNLDRPIRVAYEMRVRGEGHEPIELTAPNNPDGIVEILYSWDETGYLETWRTDRGGVSTVLRDGFGWVESVTDPVNRFVVLSNGRSSLPAEITDRNSSVIRQHYDALGRLIRREIFPAIQPQFTIEGTTLQIFQWDGLGRMTLAYDDNGPAELDDDCFTMRTYDSLGNVLQDNQTGLTVTRGFDAAGRVSRILYPGGRQIEVTRLSNGKPDEIRDGAWTYSQDNYLGDKLLERRLGNEVEISYLRPPNGGDDGGTHFDASGNITRQIWRGLVFDEETEELQEADLLNFAYGYDRAGRRLFEQRRHPELPQGDAMQYDSLGRLRLFIPNLDDPVSPPVNPPDARAINIDGNHNAILLVFNFNNTLIDVDASDRWIEIGSTAIESDRNGNVIFDGNDAFFHDFAGRVVRVERGNGSVVRFSYDASDMEQPWIRRPVGRLARRSHGTDSFQIIYDDDRIIEERRTAGSGPSIRREAIHDEGGLPVAVIENRTDGTPRTLFLLHGAGGSVAGVTDESGDLIETIKYDVYGLPFFQNASGGISKSVTDNPFLFRSMPFDTEVRMHVVGARFLSPNYLRFGSAVQVPDFVPARGSVAPVSDRQLSVLETVAPAPEPPQLPVPSHLETTGRLMAPAPLDTNAFNFNLNNPMR